MIEWLIDNVITTKVLAWITVTFLCAINKRKLILNTSAEQICNFARRGSMLYLLHKHRLGSFDLFLFLRQRTYGVWLTETQHLQQLYFICQSAFPGKAFQQWVCNPFLYPRSLHGVRHHEILVLLLQFVSYVWIA